VHGTIFEKQQKISGGRGQLKAHSGYNVTLRFGKILKRPEKATAPEKDSVFAQ